MIIHYVRPEKFQFLEKWQNRNFGYEIVISVKNPKFILYISDDETDCTVGIASRNLASTLNFVEFRDSRSDTFFKALHFGCRKTIFDVIKVTYNTYSCAMSGMSREMMTMEGRDSAECQNWEKKDIVGINRKV